MTSYFKSPPFYITLIIMAFVTFMYFNFKDKYVLDYDNPSQVVVNKKWPLPRALEEVSGISHVNDNIIACVQDEEGIIFLYNLENEGVEREINFGEQDDYEGIAIVSESAYVVNSAGKLFEIRNFKQEDFEVIIYENFLTEDHNVEGLCLDKTKNRLLLACKDNPDHRGNFKSIYAFDLKTKQVGKEPIYKLTYDNPIFDNFEEDKDEKLFRTSEIAIHPKTKDIYLLDGAIPKILILNKNWEAQELLVLDPEIFLQPEGLSFNTNGDMFIANEGDLKSSNILHVSLEEKKTSKKQSSENSNKNGNLDEFIDDPSSQI
ncbi:hypothetical protein RBU60_08685 [Mesonia sp. MT50]|uniref:Uncharacterized protein n=2 Tax=Mesonia TaxID=232115 RepID=A0ABU1A460_9FLAO|nr:MULTISPECIES: hypothetical protein [Mesonia]MDQ7917649.1 hypothetical protein [Mesonia profundi]MDT0294313.1 hypothetical protein [Mesonia ostreae]